MLPILSHSNVFSKAIGLGGHLLSENEVTDSEVKVAAKDWPGDGKTVFAGPCLAPD